MGRPKKYDNKFIESLIPKLDKWYKGKDNIWLKDFAIENGFCSEYLSRWAETNTEFSQALKRAKEIQESKLVKQGLEGKAIAFVIFALKNVAGWRDSVEVNHSKIDGVKFVED